MGSKLSNEERAGLDSDLGIWTVLFPKHCVASMCSVFALMIRLFELSPLIGRLWQQLVLGRLKIKSKPLAGKWNNQAGERRKEKRYQNPIVMLKELREKGNMIS